MVVTRCVVHDHPAKRFFRVDAHHVPRTSPAAEMLDEGRVFVPGLPRAEPAQSEVVTDPSCQRRRPDVLRRRADHDL